MRPITETGDAWLYLNAVCERPTAAMWDFVDIHGPVDAAERIRAQATEDFRAVAEETGAASSASGGAKSSADAADSTSSANAESAAKYPDFVLEDPALWI